ncbi:MAG: hypothetical protein DYH08_03955 [Actinobacteria bacterium ATB1]|nr:hypothetical protein [Actinobacteria bacterium ATB1]
MLVKWSKRLVVLSLLSVSFAFGYRLGQIPSGQRLSWGLRLLRRLTARLLDSYSNRPVLAQLQVIRTQNDRILRQNETIYRQNDRILGILSREFETAPATSVPPA